MPFLNIVFPSIPVWTIILALIVLVTVLNVVGINSVAKASNLIVGAQIIFIGVFVALSLKTLGGRQPVDVLSPFLGDGTQPGFSHLIAGAAVLCLSFLGFDAVSTLAEETKDPERNVPRAIILTTLGACSKLTGAETGVSGFSVRGAQAVNNKSAANTKAGFRFIEKSLASHQGGETRVCPAMM